MSKDKGKSGSKKDTQAQTPEEKIELGTKTLLTKTRTLTCKTSVMNSFNETRTLGQVMGEVCTKPVINSLIRPRVVKLSELCAEFGVDFQKACADEHTAKTFANVKAKKEKGEVVRDDKGQVVYQLDVNGATAMRAVKYFLSKEDKKKLPASTSSVQQKLAEALSEEDARATLKGTNELKAKNAKKKLPEMTGMGDYIVKEVGKKAHFEVKHAEVITYLGKFKSKDDEEVAWVKALAEKLAKQTGGVTVEQIAKLGNLTGNDYVARRQLGKLIGYCSCFPEAFETAGADEEATKATKATKE